MSEAYNQYQQEFSDLTEPNARNLLLACLCISEVAATVALDYWYMSHFFDDTHPEIKCLATRYKTGESAEIDSIVQNKRFFELLLPHFSTQSDPTSKTRCIDAAWFPKEQRQAALFAKIMKAWSDYRYGALPSPQSRLDPLLSSQISDFAILIRDKLWDATHEKEFGCFDVQSAHEKDRSWLSSSQTLFADYRFYNLHSNPDWLSLQFLTSDGTMSNRQYGYAVAQYIVSFDKASCRELSGCDFKSIVANRDIQQLRKWQCNQAPIASEISKRQTLIFPN